MITDKDFLERLINALAQAIDADSALRYLLPLRSELVDLHNEAQIKLSALQKDRAG